MVPDEGSDPPDQRFTKPVVALAKQLHRKHMSLREIPAALFAAGHTSKNGKPLPQADHVARRRPFDETDHVPRHGRHDPLVLVAIAVAVIDVGHAAGPVIGHAVHRVAAEAKPGDPRQAGAPKSCGVTRSIPSSPTSCFSRAPNLWPRRSSRANPC